MGINRGCAMQVPETRLPILHPDVWKGMLASEYELSDLFQNLKTCNPAVALFIHEVYQTRGEDAAKACLLLYKMLDTQAECDELV